MRSAWVSLLCGEPAPAAEPAAPAATTGTPAPDLVAPHAGATIT